MSEYLDYDEAVRANRARKKKAMAMKRKRQAQIRLIKRNLFAAILLLVISVVVTKSVKAISSRADDSNAQQQAVLTDNVIEDNNITVIQQEPVFKCAAKKPVVSPLVHERSTFVFLESDTFFTFGQVVFQLELPVSVEYSTVLPAG